MLEKPYRFRLGTLECMVFNDRVSDRTHESLLPTVDPDALKDAAVAAGLDPTDHRHVANVLVLKNGEQTIMFDAGLRENSVHERMRAAGISPLDVDIVIITHADGDHVMGLRTADDTLRFPNARYIVSERFWEIHTSPDIADPKAGKPADFIDKTIPLISDRIQTVAFGEEFLPGFTAIDGHGHRLDHTVFKITSGGETLLHVADAVVHPVQFIQPDWPGVFDSTPEEAAATRKRLLALADEENALVFGAHLPFPCTGRVKKTGDRWTFTQITEG